MNYRQVIRAAMEAVPDQHQPYLRKALDHQKRAIVIGCATELPATAPSLPEIAAEIQLSHPTVHEFLAKWRAMHWQTRHGWLTLVHRRLLDEANALDAAVRG